MNFVNLVEGLIFRYPLPKFMSGNTGKY